MTIRNIYTQINFGKLFLFKYRFTCLLIIGLNIPVFSQNIITVSGVVKDAKTHEPIEFANVVFTNSGIGECTRTGGYFSIRNDQGIKSVRISLLGYKDTIIELSKNNTVNLTVSLSSNEISLGEAVIVAKKRVPYSKKDNPAIDFMKKVIDHKNDNRIESKDYYRVERYEKFSTSLNNFDSMGKIFKKFAFLKNNIDTSEVDGTPILTLSLKESVGDMYYRKMPKTKKEVLRAKRSEGIGKDLDEGMDQNIQELFQGIDLYENSIKLFQLYFVSPLSSTTAITFYKYYIIDTVDIDGTQCLNMAFFPYNHQSLGFIGNLYISLDGNYSLLKAELKVPEKINLNFARNLKFTQTFKQLPDSSWAVAEENLYANLYLFKGLPEVQVNQFRSYKNYNLTIWDQTIFEKSESKIAQDENIINKSDTFWAANRHVPMKEKETAVKKMLNQLRQIPLYQFIVRSTEFFGSGYFLTGGSKEKSMFDIGPLPSLYSYNRVEGSRFKLGGTTTANLYPYLFVSGYVAYGIRDNKFKYNGMVTYSINKKKYHAKEFPRNNITFMYEYDIYTLGSNYQGYKDDLLVSWKVGDPVTKMSYIRTISLGYEKDWDRRFNSKIWIKNQVDKPTGTLVYRVNSGDVPEDIKSLTTSEIGIQLRYVVGGTPYSGRNPNMNFSKDATEFVLSHFVGIKDLLGGEYHYEHTEFSVKKRINLSVMGFLDAKVNMGKVWTKVPFPLLIMPNTNQSIMIQSDAFHTMRALEFVVDQYIGLNLTYHLNGVIFNRIPYVNFLKLRGVVSFNGILGSLSEKNNPLKSDGLFVLPEGSTSLGKAPFIEMSFGIENIFKFFRIDYFRRLTYTDGAKWKGGIRFSFGLTF
jgi:hypothetical protein